MEEKIKVLIVEDDPFIGLITKECFESKDFEVELYENGAEGYKAYKKFQPDICIFDVMMPIKDGFTLAQEIRKEDKDTPIIFLTAKSMKEDVIQGFKVGADDYEKKPFSVEELIARVEVILKRINMNTTKQEEISTYQIGKYQYDRDYKLLKIENNEQKLTDKEADILTYLCKNLNQIVDRSKLLIEVWENDSFFNSRSLDVYITKIRKYLKEDPDVELLTIRGKGFKLWIHSKKAFQS
ncbi:MAG: response regulator transcription factor [Flavobacteriales bacterium]|jgi:DNA-binding response OmpR family regulator|nr:response regulator transcription factor [Flavobacteriales bacterium]